MTDTKAMEILLLMIIGFYVFSIISYLLKARGLYMINKKLGEPYPWLAWIPVLQVYSYLKASGKSIKEYLLYPVGIVIGIIITSMLIGIIGGFEWLGGILGLSAGIYLFVIIIKITHGISLRTGGGTWTTIGLLFIGFIMFPVIAYKLEEKNMRKKEELKI